MIDIDIDIDIVDARMGATCRYISPVLFNFRNSQLLLIRLSFSQTYSHSKRKRDRVLICSFQFIPFPFISLHFLSSRFGLERLRYHSACRSPFPFPYFAIPSHSAYVYHGFASIP